MHKKADSKEKKKRTRKVSKKTKKPSKVVKNALYEEEEKELVSNDVEKVENHEEQQKNIPSGIQKRLMNLRSFADIPVEERRKAQSNGGKKSAEVRKKKKNIKECLQVLTEMKPSKATRSSVSKMLNIDEKEVDSNAMVLATSLFAQAVKGNVKAFESYNKIINGDITEAERINLDLKREELRIKQEQHAIEVEQYEKSKNATADEYKGIPALAISPTFAPILHDIAEHEHSEYTLDGGRGSTKSSFIALVIVHLIMTNDNLNALVLRQVANTLKDSVYNQILWAIEKLNLNHHFHCTKSPLQITRIKTSQTIFFRGADEPMKLKSIKALNGYIGIVWFEELDQFNGAEAVRNIEQSAIRGGDLGWIFKSFNPPKSKLNWANVYVLEPKENALHHHSNYLGVPKKWLGKTWLDEAEYLRVNKPEAYEHEYLGTPNGNGGNVFDNIEIRGIKESEIKQFDRILNGVDWGWYPDPFHFSRCYFDSARRFLYIFDEFRCNKKSNLETHEEVKKRLDDEGEIVICDSAEEKSIGDYRAYGINARRAEKGAGSVDYSMKWLQSLIKIIIDPKRCPYTKKEFMEYEYLRDKEGNVITGYPDRDNHAIDSVRYATNQIWKRRGE